MTQPTATGIEPTLSEVLQGDPLSEVTRKTRLYLLAVSLIGVAMVRTGLVPTKIATFGIELEQPNRSALLFLIALVNLYFLAAFVIYALSDFRTWRDQMEAARENAIQALRFQLAGHVRDMSVEAIRKRYSNSEEDLAFWESTPSNWPEKSPNWLIERASTEELLTLFNDKPLDVRIHTDLIPAYSSTGYLRGFFEFVLPILVGLFGIGALLFRIFSG
jgi:hypothetical protein